MQISRLRVGNEDFLVSSMIERCPKAMMLRELVKNALEAAARAPEGDRRAIIAPLVVDGVRKLSVWNTGPGMDAEELYRMCDIASSIGKVNGLDQNFGMGAKVASLPSNHHGIRYRSCKAGRVHQVLMGKREAAYGRLHQIGPDGQPVDVLDVTEAARGEGYAVGSDWTEVVLLGQRPDQDTVANPYDGNPGVSAAWIAEELYNRFYVLPAGITLTLREGCHTAGGDRPFVPLGARTAEFDRYEAVPAEHGITLHYFFDAADPEHPDRNRSARGALQTSTGTTGLIHRGEVYEVLPQWAWRHDAPVFGIPFGSRNLSVLIELPDDYPLLPDGYRQFLRHRDNLQHQLRPRDFASMVLRYRPAWLLELLRNFAPDSRHTESLQGEMAGMFRSLRIHRRWWPPGGDGTPPPPGNGEPEYEVAPQIMPLRDARDIEERGLANKAARFYGETHQLFINTLYSGFESFRTVLEQEFASAEDQELMRRTALTTTEQILTRQVCRKLVFGLSKRELWHGWEVDQATSMYSLSLAVDDQTALLAEARAEMRKHFAGAPAPADPRLEEARTRLASAMEELLSLRPSNASQPIEVTMRLA